MSNKNRRKSPEKPRKLETRDQHTSSETYLRVTENLPLVPSVTPAVLASRTADGLAQVSGFAALIAFCALLPALPTAILPVPITLQTLGVVTTALILAPVRAVGAVSLYLAIGAVGVPVFSMGKAGIAVLSGPTGGFLLGFIPWVALVSLLVRPQIVRIARSPRHRSSTFNRRFSLALAAVAALGLSVVTVHLIGILILARRVGLSFEAAALADLVFLPGDCIKVTVGVLVAFSVHRVFQTSQD